MCAFFGNLGFAKCFLRIQKYAYVHLNTEQILRNYNFSKGAQVFITSFGEISTSLTYISFTTVWTCQFV